MGGLASLISSYYLTVSNGCSLTTLKSVEVTQHSGSFKWRGSASLIGLSYYLTVSNGHSLTVLKKRRGHSVLWQFQMGGGQLARFTLTSANFELTCHFMLCFTGLFVLHTKEWMFSHVSPQKPHKCVLKPSGQCSFFQDDQFEGSHA